MSRSVEAGVRTSSGIALLARVTAVLVVLATPFGVRAAVPASGPVAPVAAQSPTNGAPAGRAARWAARRAEKRNTQAEPRAQDTPGALGVLAAVARRSTHHDDAAGGLMMIFGGHESGHGAQGGVRYRTGVAPFQRLGNRADLTVQALASYRGYSAFTGRLELGALGGTGFGAALHGMREDRRRDSFYGIGPDTGKGGETAFGLVSEMGGGELWWDRAGWPRLGGGADLVAYDQRPPEGSDDPAARDIFVAGEAPGLALETRFVRWRAFVEDDRRDMPGDTRSGSLWRASFEAYEDRRHELYDFDLLSIEGRHYFPFLHARRVIAVRFLSAFTSTSPGRRVPFYLLPSLGGPDDLRALPPGRFRGANKLLLQTEYRWEPWRALDMALFFDAGQVFDDAGEVGLDRLSTAYGLGFRFKAEEWMLLRLDFAHGNEGFALHTSFNRNF